MSKKGFRDGCRRRTSILACAVGFGALFGCGDGPSDAGRDSTPLAVATTGIVADVAKRVAGEDVRVVALMPPGVDPHLYKPSAGDVRRLADADLVLYNGLSLEGKMVSVLAKMARDRAVLAVAEAIDVDRLRKVDDASAFDPHVWFDVSIWAGVADPIAEAMAGLVPDRAAEFRRRAQAWRDELESLDAWVAARVREIPPERRVLVTAHDAFGYFGRRYGVEVVGLQGMSTVAEAGLADVDRVVERILRNRVPAVFIESSISPRTLGAVRAACAERGHEVAIGGELFSDALGASGTPEGSYVGAVRHNVDTIVEALR